MVNKTYKIIVHTDAGHGWGECYKSELQALGIADKITGFSRVRGEKVYLEEDCDLTEFENAIKKHFPDVKIEYKSIYDGDHSPIRSYCGYMP